MIRLYLMLAAVHIMAVVVTGILWTLFVLRPTPGLRREFRDIRAVHFGSLFLVPWLLSLACLLVLLSGIGYILPSDTSLDPFYFWTSGWAMILSLAGLACLIIALCWTAAVLVVYAWPRC